KVSLSKNENGRAEKSTISPRRKPRRMPRFTHALARHAPSESGSAARTSPRSSTSRNRSNASRAARRSRASAGRPAWCSMDWRRSARSDMLRGMSGSRLGGGADVRAVGREDAFARGVGDGCQREAEAGVDQPHLGEDCLDRAGVRLVEARPHGVEEAEVEPPRLGEVAREGAADELARGAGD